MILHNYSCCNPDIKGVDGWQRPFVFNKLLTGGGKVEIKLKVTAKTQPKSETRKLVEREVKDLSRKELAKQAKALFSTVNKRIKRLQNSDVVSPALDALKKKRTPHFTTGGKSLEQLQKEYSEALAFYNLETGTVTGARAFTNKLENMLGERVHDRDYLAKTFDLLHTVQNRLPELYKNKFGTDPQELQNMIERVEGLEEQLYSDNAEEQEKAMSELLDNIIKQLTDELQQTIDSIINNAAKSLGGTLF